MYILSVTVKVKPESVVAFIDASLANHAGSRREPGNLRWDLLQAADDSTHFMLYEVYRTEDDFKAHRQTPHFLLWQETVADMMAEPRARAVFTNIAPKDADWGFES